MWNEQVAAARTGDTQDAPLVDEDAAMLLVDQALVGAEGSQRPCTRAEMRAAFAYLASPLVQRAVWANDVQDAIVVVAPSASR